MHTFRAPSYGVTDKNSYYRIHSTANGKGVTVPSKEEFALFEMIFEKIYLTGKIKARTNRV